MRLDLHGEVLHSVGSRVWPEGVRVVPVAVVEAGVGAGACGARGAVDCAGAEVGWTAEVRGAWQVRPWLGLGATGLYGSLPAAGSEAGTLWYVGPEVVVGVEPSPGVRLHAAGTVGWDRVAGTGGRLAGLGALGLRLGGRYRLDALLLGLDYGLLAPRVDEACTGGVCDAVEVALLHRFTVVVGAAFW